MNHIDSTAGAAAKDRTPTMRFAYADPPYLGCGALYARKDVPWLLSEVSRLTAEIDRANRALNEIIALDEKGPAWEPYDEFGDPSDIDESNSGGERRHGAWTAYQWAARIARAARTQPEGSND